MRYLHYLYLLFLLSNASYAQDTVFLVGNKIATGKVEILRGDRGLSQWRTPKIKCNDEIYAIRKFTSFKMGDQYYFNIAKQILAKVIVTGKINATTLTITRIDKYGTVHKTPSIAIQKGSNSPVIQYRDGRLKKMFSDCPEALKKYQELKANTPKVTFRTKTVEDFHQGVLSVIQWYNENCGG